jgi:hypothetical protein
VFFANVQLYTATHPLEADLRRTLEALYPLRLVMIAG